MRTYNPVSVSDLHKRNVCKQDLFDGYVTPFDYALPQGWLTAFSDWCKEYSPSVSYQLIRSTCVWSYPVNASSAPCTACKEVFTAYADYTAHYV